MVGFRKLWLSVIVLAWSDARGTPGPHRDNARAWFQRGSADFRLVCDLAGIEPEWLRDGALEALGSDAGNWPPGPASDLPEPGGARGGEPTEAGAVLARLGEIRRRALELAG